MLSENQEQLIIRGTGFNRRHGKPFIEILKENCTEADLIKVAIAVKEELIKITEEGRVHIFVEFSRIKKIGGR